MILCRKPAVCINIYFNYIGDIANLGFNLLQNRRLHFAGTTPCCKKVNQNGFRLIDEFVEIIHMKKSFLFVLFYQQTYPHVSLYGKIVLTLPGKITSMEQPVSLRGMGVALATPFRNDFSVDYDALEHLIDYQIVNGADYLVVLATTSEAVTLSCPERHEVARFVAEKTAGRVPLIMGMSNNCTAELVRHIPEVDFTGYSAILSVVPYYNKPSQEGIYRHFKAIAEASPLPIVLYNVPSRTGKNMEAETTLRLAHEFPGKIAGIKEASGNLEQAAAIIAGKPDGFSVVSGDDSLTRHLICLGAEGVISVVGNALPRLFSTMVHLTLEDHSSIEAENIDRSMQALDKALFAEGNPSGLKCLLHHLGLAENVLRLPLVPVSDKTDKDIAEALSALSTQIEHTGHTSQFCNTEINL